MGRLLGARPTGQMTCYYTGQTICFRPRPCFTGARPRRDEACASGSPGRTEVGRPRAASPVLSSVGRGTGEWGRLGSAVGGASCGLRGVPGSGGGAGLAAVVRVGAAVSVPGRAGPFVGGPGLVEPAFDVRLAFGESVHLGPVGAVAASNRSMRRSWRAAVRSESPARARPTASTVPMMVRVSASTARSVARQGSPLHGSRREPMTGTGRGQTGPDEGRTRPNRRAAIATMKAA